MNASFADRNMFRPKNHRDDVIATARGLDVEAAREDALSLDDEGTIRQLMNEEERVISQLNTERNRLIVEIAAVKATALRAETRDRETASYEGLIELIERFMSTCTRIELQIVDPAIPIAQRVHRARQLLESAKKILASVSNDSPLDNLTGNVENAAANVAATVQAGLNEVAPFLDKANDTAMIVAVVIGLVALVMLVREVKG